MTKDEVIIVGGGPAGSALGCYLSKAGIKNTIFEAANHPRPHVGESMVMSSVRVFDEIGGLTCPAPCTGHRRPTPKPNS